LGAGRKAISQASKLDAETIQNLIPAPGELAYFSQERRCLFLDSA
jgi:hypothetical protein